MSTTPKPTVHLGADHGGFLLKEELRKWLEAENYPVVDHGATILNPEDDYPERAFEVAEAVVNHPAESARGVLICRSSGGVTIAANKVHGARAVAVVSPELARHAVEHNNANILALSSDWGDTALTLESVKAFLETTFKGEERHVRRLTKIADYERTHAAISSSTH